MVQFIDAAIKFVEENEKWWLSCKMSRQIGQAFYLKGDTKNGFKWMRKSLDHCEQNYGTVQDRVLTHVIWCYTLVWSGLHDVRNLCFVHMRQALRFDTCYNEYVISSLKKLFHSAIVQTPMDEFYSLCIAYIELELKNYVEAEKCFKRLADRSYSMNSLLGMVECLLGREKVIEAQEWLDQARTLSASALREETDDQLNSKLQDKLINKLQENITVIGE